MFISSRKAWQLKDQIIRLQVKLEEKEEALQKTIEAQKRIAKELLILAKLNSKHTLYTYSQVMMDINTAINECASNLEVNDFSPYEHLYNICDIMKITGAASHPLITPTYKKIIKIRSDYNENNREETISLLNDVHSRIDSIFDDLDLDNDIPVKLEMQAGSYMWGLILQDDDL